VAGGAQSTRQPARATSVLAAGRGARCDAPRRVSLGASGAAGGAHSTRQPARMEGVLVARRLASRATMRHAASPLEPAAWLAARIRLGNWRVRLACWRLGGSRRTMRCATPRLPRSQRRGWRRAVDSATGAHVGRAGGWATRGARCDAPRRVFIEASGVAGGAQSARQTARMEGVLAARRLAAHAAMRHAASPSEPAARLAARSRLGNRRVRLAFWRLGGWRRERRGAAPRLPRSQRRGGRRAVDSATGACD